MALCQFRRPGNIEPPFCYEAMGFTKLLFDPETYRILGAGIVGSNAGELIAEVALAIESGCDAGDIGSRQAQCWSP